ncbi:DUF6959 family protein [Streptomyces sp. NPDC059718]
MERIEAELFTDGGNDSVVRLRRADAVPRPPAGGGASSR